MESQFKDMYEKQHLTQNPLPPATFQPPSLQPPQNPNPQQHPSTVVDLLDIDSEPINEELERLRKQCAKVCEEMRRLQEDNEDISVALEAEKLHKEKIFQQHKQQVDQLQL